MRHRHSREVEPSKYAGDLWYTDSCSQLPPVFRVPRNDSSCHRGMSRRLRGRAFDLCIRNAMGGRKATITMDRRTFLESAAASACFTILPRHVMGGPGVVPPSDKITLAYI